MQNRNNPQDAFNQQLSPYAPVSVVFSLILTLNFMNFTASFFKTNPEFDSCILYPETGEKIQLAPIRRKGSL